MAELEIFTEDLPCDEKCVYEWVDCMEAEDDAPICKNSGTKLL